MKNLFKLILSILLGAIFIHATFGYENYIYLEVAQHRIIPSVNLGPNVNSE